MNNYDSHNEKPDIVLLKEEIVLNYFVTSIMHQMFALKDLEIDEEIMDYRGKEGAFGMQSFEVGKILEKLIKEHPDNCALYNGLGEFYYEVFLKYQGNWLKDDNELQKLMKINFQKAIDGGCADFLSYYVLGYQALVEGKNKECIPFFRESIELNAEFPSSHYNLAYAYLFLNDRENAAHYAENSYKLYTDPEYKSDAARMLGQIYAELNEESRALVYFEEADSIDPGNFYNLRPILDIQVKTGHPDAAKTLSAFFNLAPGNPSIYNTLEDIYYSYKKENELIAFYKVQLDEFKGDYEVIGSLDFYLGKIYLNEDKKIATEYLLEAQAMFKKVFNDDHQVFDVIKEALQQAK